MIERFSISAIELLVLLKGVMDAAKHPDIGYADPHFSLEQLIERYNRKDVSISVADLESCLWSLNMLTELNIPIWHPEKRSFDGFLTKMIDPPFYFDKHYNVIKMNKKGGS